MNSTMLALLCLNMAACSQINTKPLEDAADEVPRMALYQLCHVMTVGSWQRLYSADPMKAQAWAQLCGQPTIVIPSK